MLLYKRGLYEATSLRGIATVSPFDFSENTTYGLGGKADKGYFPNTIYQAKLTFDALKASGRPVTVLGLGSNVLASDDGFNGAVISTRNLRGIIRLSGNRLLCLSGTKISELLTYCKKHSLGGLEFMYGIPATVGGAAFMNAGIGGNAIGDFIESVTVYDGKSAVLSHEKCNFGYRRSTMRDINTLILSIIVKTNESNCAEIEEKINYYRVKRSHLPKGRSCGCVFKNPDGTSAGYLIDSAGLKGLRVGGAVVSNEHASFILNEGGSSTEVKSLIEIVKSRVFERFGVLLEEEVVYIGEFL